MSSAVPSSPEALREAFALADELLRNIEVEDVSLAKLALKTARLARLLNDDANEKMFRWEASGYPTSQSGMPQDAWDTANCARRNYEAEDPETKKISKFVYIESIDAIEQELAAAKTRLQVIGNAPMSGEMEIKPFMPPPHIAWAQERSIVQQTIRVLAGKYAARRSLIHEYALLAHSELRFSGIAADIFTRIRERVDRAVGARVPESVRKFSAVYENLNSTNPEDWSNAVHSCRRILQDLADALYPPRADKEAQTEGKTRPIKLGLDNYINRLIAYVQERTTSERFEAIVGSQLSYLGERLDAVFAAAQKGSHATVAKDDADRFVVYTYLLVGDILALGGEA